MTSVLHYANIRALRILLALTDWLGMQRASVALRCELFNRNQDDVPALTGPGGGVA